jgi:hypothetical protein
MLLDQESGRADEGNGFHLENRNLSTRPDPASSHSPRAHGQGRLPATTQDISHGRIVFRSTPGTSHSPPTALPPFGVSCSERSLMVHAPMSQASPSEHSDAWRWKEFVKAGWSSESNLFAGWSSPECTSRPYVRNDQEEVPTPFVNNRTEPMPIQAAGSGDRVERTAAQSSSQSAGRPPSIVKSMESSMEDQNEAWYKFVFGDAAESSVDGGAEGTPDGGEPQASSRPSPKLVGASLFHDPPASHSKHPCDVLSAEAGISSSKGDGQVAVLLDPCPASMSAQHGSSPDPLSLPEPPGAAAGLELRMPGRLTGRRSASTIVHIGGDRKGSFLDGQWLRQQAKARCRARKGDS